jgi:hypothetical protein
MITIRDTKLFNELVEESKMENGDTWNALFVDCPEHSKIVPKNNNIPVFAGGLDHIDVKPRGVYFYDIGCNDRDHSFVIRPELG